VDRTGEDLLADARLALEQHRCAHVRQDPRLLDGLSQAAVRSHDAREDITSFFAEPVKCHGGLPRWIVGERTVDG
jgi:hypothetical protein